MPDRFCNKNQKADWRRVKYSDINNFLVWWQKNKVENVSNKTYFGFEQTTGSNIQQVFGNKVGLEQKSY